MHPSIQLAYATMLQPLKRCSQNMYTDPGPALEGPELTRFKQMVCPQCYPAEAVHIEIEHYVWLDLSRTASHCRRKACYLVHQLLHYVHHYAKQAKLYHYHYPLSTLHEDQTCLCLKASGTQSNTAIQPLPRTSTGPCILCTGVLTTKQLLTPAAAALLPPLQIPSS
jgi:hypothetical protein